MTSIDKELPKINTLNLGDSGYMLVRKHANGTEMEVVFRSKEQQYSFNFPYQCGTNCDPPSYADSNSHSVKDGDILLLASDGVFDNVFE